MKLLKFSAKWCAPCKVMEKELEDFDEMPIQNVDIENNQELTSDFKVRKVPTIVLVGSDGEEIWRHVGAISKTDLIKKIREN